MRIIAVTECFLGGTGQEAPGSTCQTLLVDIDALDVSNESHRRYKELIEMALVDPEICTNIKPEESFTVGNANLDTGEDNVLRHPPCKIYGMCYLVYQEEESTINQLKSIINSYHEERQKIRSLFPESGEDNDFSLIDCIERKLGIWKPST